ncbi:MAG: beta-L-arabinofuranosidase domain-containing protein [Clostridia bacterium]
MYLIPDAFHTLPAGSWHFTGDFDRAIRFVQEKQLKNAAVWKQLADPFRTGCADDENFGWRGEYWGKLMRGACLTYAYTQDETLYEILEASVRDLLSTQDSGGRFSTYSTDREFRGWDVWCRKYVLLGLQYFLEIYKGDALRKEILKAMIRHADAILAKIGPVSEGKLPVTKTSEIWGGMNSSSILEPFVRLYVLTGMRRYLDFAEHIIANGGAEAFDLFRAAEEDRLAPYEYPVTKAYEMMSCFEGLLWYYRVTGKKNYLDAAERFTARVMRSDITIIGSAGCTHELFDHSAIRQFDPAFGGIMQETCVTVTWMKLCYLLLQITGNVKYAEAIERSACNALLGAVNTELQPSREMVPVFDSYSPLRQGRRGQAVGGFQRLNETFSYGCCLAIGAAGTAYTALSSVSKTAAGLALHFYQPGFLSALTPGGRQVKIAIDTRYPADGKISITVHLPSPERFEILLRLPQFGKGSTLFQNGRKIAEYRSGFYAVDRLWNDGDTITILADLSLQLLKDSDLLPEAALRPVRYGALLRGPVVLALDQRANSCKIDDILQLGDGPVRAKAIPEFRSFPVSQAYAVRSGARDYIFVDYASAGKIWDDAFPIAAWFRFSDSQSVRGKSCEGFSS